MEWDQRHEWKGMIKSPVIWNLREIKAHFNNYPIHPQLKILRDEDYAQSSSFSSPPPSLPLPPSPLFTPVANKVKKQQMIGSRIVETNAHFHYERGGGGANWNISGKPNVNDIMLVPFAYIHYDKPSLNMREKLPPYKQHTT